MTVPCGPNEFRAEWKPAAEAASCQSCGVGVNITKTDRIVVYDPANPSNETQISVATSADDCCECVIPVHSCCPDSFPPSCQGRSCAQSLWSHFAGVGRAAATAALGDTCAAAAGCCGGGTHDQPKLTLTNCACACQSQAHTHHTCAFCWCAPARAATPAPAPVAAVIQAGQGLLYQALENSWRAVNCDSNNYGVANETYGLTPAPCRACPQDMVTSKNRNSYPMSARW